MQDMYLGFKSRTVVTGFLALAGSAMCFAVYSGHNSHELERLREQNRVVTAQLNELQVNIDKLKSFTGHVRSLATGELTPSQIKEQDELSATLNSPAEAEGYASFAFGNNLGSTLENITPGKGDLETFSETMSTIRDLNRDANQVSRRLRTLARILRHNEELISKIPSLKPAAGRVTSEFGIRLSPFDGMRQMHAGIDIASSVGAPVRAPAEGIVTFVGDFETLGNTIVVDHGAGIMTRYGHLSRSLVKVGAKINRGEVIATVGNTGRSTGPHLHYEVWIKNNAVDPRDFFYDLNDQPTIISKSKPNKAPRSNAAMGGGSSYR